MGWLGKKHRIVDTLAENVYSVGVRDWDRRLFDELIPLPDGTSYNSYLIVGSEKTALVDTVDPSKEKEFQQNLEKTGVKKIDYVIANHAEQDHSGCIPHVLEKHPEAKVVCSEKCNEFLKDLLLIGDDKFKVVSDGEKLTLGDKTLEFIHAPWVHWPETILTYLVEEKILFPCDLFGSHMASSDLYVKDEAKTINAAKRYYAEIMMPFRTMIKSHLKKLGDYEINVIAASHGPVYDKPSLIIDAYKKWVSDEVHKEVIVPYVSAHGSTKKMVEYFVDSLVKRGMSVKPYNLTKTDLGDLAMALVDASTVVLATPTILVGAHPQAVYTAYLMNALKPKTRFVSVIGSYGWGSQAVEQIKALIKDLKVELLEPVYVKGHPNEECLKQLDRLADDIVKKHKENNILS